MIILTIISILSITIFYKTDSCNIIHNFITEKYSKWKRLNNLVSTQHSSQAVITWISLKMVGESLYQNLIHYLNNSVVKLNKNTYVLSYVINGKMYKNIIIPKRGPLPIVCVLDTNDNDISDIVLPYLGPHNDWNNYKFTPSFFNYKELKFELSNGEFKTFKDSDIIEI